MKFQTMIFRKIITVIRLAVPYTGMILTARENAAVRDKLIKLGITQIDASSKIGVGAYIQAGDEQKTEKQQFELGDTRSLDTVVRELAQKGTIVSFCTAGYRCGRTGEVIMECLKHCKEGVFCKLNAIITYREWLDDFASEETKKVAVKVIDKEIQEVKEKLPDIYEKFMQYYSRTLNGERDLYF